MRVEIRQHHSSAMLVLISESLAESLLMDTVFGKIRREDGFISDVVGICKLDDNYLRHYIRLQKSNKRRAVKAIFRDKRKG